MFFIIDKSKFFSYTVAICTVLTLFVVATVIDKGNIENVVTTSTNIVEKNNIIGNNN